MTPPQRSLRVLHVIDSGGLYGAERVMLALAVKQAADGMAPVILLLRPAPLVSDAAARAGIPCTTLSATRAWLTALNLLAAVRSHGADLVHSHGFKGNILLAALPRRLLGGVPVVTTVHGWTETTVFSRMAWYGRLDRALLGRCDAVVFVHRDAPRWYGIDAQRLARAAVIENGVMPSAERRRVMGPPASGLAERLARAARGRPVLLSVGRLSPEKGHRYLVLAVAELRRAGHDLLCVVLGEGGCRAELEQLGRDPYVGRDALRLPGFSELDDEVFAQATVFCLPSLTEGMPLALIEAMGAGLPIVATPVGGVPAMVAGAGGCRLAPPADPRALAGALAAALSEPRPGPRPNLERFSSERMAREYGALYREVLGGVIDHAAADARPWSPVAAPPRGPLTAR